MSDRCWGVPVIQSGFEGISPGHKNIGPQLQSPSHKPYKPPTPGGTLTQRQGISPLSALYLLSDPTQSIQANLQPTNLKINSINFLPAVCSEKRFRMNKL